MSNYIAYTVSKGQGGWGGPLVIEPTDQKKYIVSITGGGIHPVAQEIANRTNGIAVDGFKNPVESNEMACVVIDCGGTARCGVYPKMGILTININATSPSGPLMAYIKEDNFVSGVQVKDLGDKAGAAAVQSQSTNVKSKKSADELKREARETVKSMQNNNTSIIGKVGRLMGGVVNVFYQAGRETVEMVLKNILPFMAFVSTLMGIIVYTGIGDIIAKFISPLAGTLPGLLVISLV
jgi:PTS system glucitol/sorbitol-specific IIB component